MIELTIFILILLSMMRLKFNKNLIIFPSIIIGLLFAFSLSVLLYKYKDWGVSISVNVLLLITLTFLALSIGEIFILSAYKRSRNYHFNNKEVSSIINVPERTIAIQSIFLLLMCLYVYYQIKNISSFNGIGYSGLDQILQSARDQIITKGAALDSLGAVFNSIAQGFYFAYIYIFINNHLITKKIKPNIRYLIIPSIFLLFATLSTTRTVFALMIFYFIGVYIILSIKQKSNSSNGIIKEITKPVIFTVIIFVAMFQIIGTIKGSIQEFSSPVQSLEVYIASPLVALNKSLLDKNTEEISDFGACTLSNFTEKINKKLKGCKGGFIQYDYSPNSDQFAYTNVYTGIDAYVKDYGIFGLFIIMIFIGMFYAFIFTKTLHPDGRKSIKWVIVYSILLYAPFMFIFDDLFSEIFANITLWIACILSVLIVLKSQKSSGRGDVILHEK